jgi:serine/threonine protein kinase
MRHDAPDQPGAAVRRYRVERLIGTGGAAAVYEARRLGPNGPGERVACKVMHAERRDAPGFRARVWDEAVLGLRHTAGHPNLVEVLDFFDDAQEQLCIVMEHVDGASVAELREPEKRLPFPIARRIAQAVLEALVHLHGRNVLYRDLSLRNILVTAGGAVKVTDFGIARMMEQGQVHTSEIRGTSIYLSPEALNRFPLDARADLFSLGAVVFDLVAGVPPCGDQHMLGTIFARTMLGMFEPLPPDTPADLAELIIGLLQTDRDARRPQTAVDALALLRSHGQPLASHEELAALVGPAKTRHDQALADDRLANVLPPGSVLAPRDDRSLTERASGKSPERVAGHAAEALPERVAENELEVLPVRAAPNDPALLPAGVASFPANPLPDLVACFGAERVARLIDGLPADPSPNLFIALESDGAREHAAAHAGEAVPEHIDDVPPDALAGRVPAAVPDPPGVALADRVAEGASGRTLNRRSRLARRFVTRSVAFRAVLGACVLVLGSLLDDGFRREQAAVELQQRPGDSGLVAKPVPAPPVAIVPAPARRSPHRALESADGPRHDRIETQSRDQHTRPPARRREYVPPASKWPPWVQR